jgi:hypothetical protein
VIPTAQNVRVVVVLRLVAGNVQGLISAGVKGFCLPNVQTGFGAYQRLPPFRYPKAVRSESLSLASIQCQGEELVELYLYDPLYSLMACIGTTLP